MEIQITNLEQGALVHLHQFTEPHKDTLQRPTAPPTTERKRYTSATQITLQEAPRNSERQKSWNTEHTALNTEHTALNTEHAALNKEQTPRTPQAALNIEQQIQPTNATYGKTTQHTDQQMPIPQNVGNIQFQLPDFVNSDSLYKGPNVSVSQNVNSTPNTHPPIERSDRCDSRDNHGNS